MTLKSVMVHGDHHHPSPRRGDAEGAGGWQNGSEGDAHTPIQATHDVAFNRGRVSCGLEERLLEKHVRRGDTGD